MEYLYRYFNFGNIIHRSLQSKFTYTRLVLKKLNETFKGYITNDKSIDY